MKITMTIVMKFMFSNFITMEDSAVNCSIVPPLYHLMTDLKHTHTCHMNEKNNINEATF